ncbi:MAG: nicotinate-nucleotide--dimethylbenzimidazole phosphoribosyltransferase [Candidatus Omnitrophica bacterium]|nr:nicotinate-nucleotide--dimethylbenzimidazole phosphoribosyltransferase [Candidatus Omnitrophota bacterium]
MKLLNETVGKIEQIDFLLQAETQRRLDNLTKPQGSLGRLEDLAKQVVEITRVKKPLLTHKVVFVMAGDHGVTEEGVSAFPKEVTPQMVYNFLRGGAGINVLSQHVGARVVVADMGVAVDLTPSPELIVRKVGYGTKNMAKGPAMSREEAIKSIENGISIFETEFKKGIHLAATGEMGIGNTTPASAIVSVITGRTAADVTGKGTGIDDAGWAKKVAVIRKSIEVNKPDATDGLDVLSKVGGYEIGGLTGVILAAAARRVPVVVDGFISSSAALVACVIEPKVKDYLIASHVSVEQGHKVVWDYLGLKPVLDLGLRLGEGTGAALAMGIVDAGVKVLLEMSTFEAAGVSEKGAA